MVSSLASGLRTMAKLAISQEVLLDRMATDLPKVEKLGNTQIIYWYSVLTTVLKEIMVGQV